MLAEQIYVVASYRHDQEGDGATCQILLMLEPLIRCQQDVKSSLGQVEELAVLGTTPAFEDDGRNLMPIQFEPKLMGDTFVKQHKHRRL